MSFRSKGIWFTQVGEPLRHFCQGVSDRVRSDRVIGAAAESVLGGVDQEIRELGFHFVVGDITEE